MAQNTRPSPSDQGTNLTTFVQADPTTFRALVQKLTGATDDPAETKLPLTVPARSSAKPVPDDMGPRKPAFKLQERRHSTRKLELNLGSPRCRNLKGDMLLVSPVSLLDLFSFSPKTPVSPRSSLDLTSNEEEQRVIAEKGFYLHPSPLNTPRSAEPELLPLFPLHSPREPTSS